MTSPGSRIGAWSLRLSLVAAFVALGACGGAANETNTTEAAAADDSAKVTIEGLAFGPGEVTITAGGTVVWTNNDEVDHTVTSGEPGEAGVPGVDDPKPPKTDGLFDGALKTVDSTFSFDFDEPGTYPYFCRVHEAMTGVITVE